MTSLRPGRRFAVASAALLVLFVGMLLAAGWYFSSMVYSGLLKPDHTPPEFNLVIVSVEGDRIVLKERQGKNVDSLADSELWGLEAESGYGQVGDVLEVDGENVTREFALLSGSISAGDHARLDSFAFKGDPRTSRGLDFRPVSISSPLGSFPAWKLDGIEDTWVVFVHGWRSDREEALRILPTVSSLGLHSLVITYRNDEGAPPSADGLIWWGRTEWRDVEAAVDYALAEGAREVVLYGYSMGGGIVVRFLEESERAGVVAGAVLDSPVLDFDTLVDFQAGRKKIPGFITSIAKRMTAWRFGVDWGDMDHMKNISRVHVPILLFHGDEDDRSPLKMSERLAAERADIVTFVVGRGAGHVRTWNIGPEAYEAKVREFLSGAVRRPD